MAPAIGVPNIEEKPALIPQITSFLRSLLFNFKKSAKIEESPAPICAQGPSFPTEPPPAIVITVAISLTGTIDGFIFPEYL